MLGTRILPWEEGFLRSCLERPPSSALHWADEVRQRVLPSVWISPTSFGTMISCRMGKKKKVSRDVLWLQAEVLAELRGG